MISVLNVDEPPPEMTVLTGAAPGDFIIQWTGVANHHYTIHQSSNLMSGFTILQEHIPFDPDVNSYTGAAEAAAQTYWMISTDP